MSSVSRGAWYPMHSSDEYLRIITIIIIIFHEYLRIIIIIINLRAPWAPWVHRQPLRRLSHVDDR
jgi:hypothetical protein